MAEKKMPAKPGEPLATLLAAVSHVGDECLIWPHSCFKQGYGQIRHQDKSRQASRVICELAHGPAPSPKHEAAHNCGNRKCYNPHHIRWATSAENSADRIRHGTFQYGERTVQAKLTDAAVREIKAQRGRVFQRDLAARFGVSRTTISAIHTGKNWAWV